MKKNKPKTKKKKEVQLGYEELMPLLHAELIDLMLRDDLFVLFELCGHIKRDDVDVQSRVFTKLLQKKAGSSFMDFIKLLIQKEVDDTIGEGTLFRNNNMCISMMSAHARTIGIEYLKLVITPLIQYIRHTDKSLEVDPSKLENSTVEILAENSNHLISVLDNCLNSLIDFVEKIPNDIRTMSYLVQESAKVRFPNSLHTCIGGFYFLRFVCPALVAPDGHKLVTEPISITERRPFVLISKSMQNLSNNTTSKEDFMEALNDWVKNNIDRVNSFFDVIPAKLEPNNYDKIDTELTENEMSKFIAFVRRHLQSVEEKFEKVSESFIHNHQYNPITAVHSFLERLDEAEAAHEAKKKKK